MNRTTMLIALLAVLILGANRDTPSNHPPYAWVLSGTSVQVNPAVPASAGRDADDR